MSGPGENTAERAGIALAAELQDAFDDEKRHVWGEGPWEHLGDAERDVRVLLAGVAALAARVLELEQERDEAWGDCDRAIELAEAKLRDAESALAFIAGHHHDSPSFWLNRYRENGGSYGGLQAVAEVALDVLSVGPAGEPGPEPHVTLHGLPPDLIAVLRDQSIIVPQDAAVFELIASWAKAPSNTASADLPAAQPDGGGDE